MFWRDIRLCSLLYNYPEPKLEFYNSVFSLSYFKFLKFSIINSLILFQKCYKFITILQFLYLLQSKQRLLLSWLDCHTKRTMSL